MSNPSSIKHWDSNPRPLKHESSPLTTRPGLPPKGLLLLRSSPAICIDIVDSPRDLEVKHCIEGVLPLVLDVRADLQLLAAANDVSVHPERWVGLGVIRA